ncbi:MAG: tRNA (adenosine(37)-N6)-threonylcarbamoyltransferase complex transferase subunit TsaD [Candidatus Niyogibacteria bacterium]|nr:MAG: tRNA (adenosine(37)-N6)-threonylcarbamoyltransferase complex transferase subunit TsaD [Candidatus Niyogibacteria bacterium]
MVILGIETSCDETGAALVEASGGLKNTRFRVLKNLVASQIKIHAPYGGVVPNLARREHEKNLPILFRQIFGNSKSQITKHKQIPNSQFHISNFDAIAVTTGPGLEPCLWRGITFAQELAEKHNKPIIAMNHMEGHIASVLLPQNGGISKSEFLISKQIEFPALALLVSGGHTELVLIKNWLNYKIIGETLDDAVGEAFDKVARLLGLPYPGGPALSALADKKTKHSVSSKISLPRPMINSKDLNFSFSGLKTAVLYALRDNPKTNKAALAKEFQNAAVDVLVSKTMQAVEIHKPKTLIVAGGVAANKHLQKAIKRAMEKLSSSQTLFPSPQFVGDNAAMIAAAGYFHAFKKNFTKPSKLKAAGRLRL